MCSVARYLCSTEQRYVRCYRSCRRLLLVVRFCWCGVVAGIELIYTVTLIAVVIY